MRIAEPPLPPSAQRRQSVSSLRRAASATITAATAPAGRNASNHESGNLNLDGDVIHICSLYVYTSKRLNGRTGAGSVFLAASWLPHKLSSWPSPSHHRCGRLIGRLALCDRMEQEERWGAPLSLIPSRTSAAWSLTLARGPTAPLEDPQLPRILLLGAEKATLDAVSDLPHQFAAGLPWRRCSGRTCADGMGLDSPSLLSGFGEFWFRRRCGTRGQRPLPERGSLSPDSHLLWGKNAWGIVHERVGGYRSFEALPGSDRFQHVLDLFEELGGHLSVNLYVDRRSRPRQQQIPDPADGDSREESIRPDNRCALGARGLMLPSLR